MFHRALPIGLVLGFLSLVGPLTMDMYLPAIPSISRDLGTSIADVHFTLTAYLLGFGPAQLLYGPISDHVGRKKPLYFGLSLFIFGSLGSVLAPTIEVLIVARFIQGIGGAAAIVIPRAMVRDLHIGLEAARMMSMIMMVISVSPMLAPLAGSGVLLIGGWRAVFLVLMGLAVLNLLSTRFILGETLSSERRVAIGPRSMIQAIFILLRDPNYVGLTLVGSFGHACFMTFLASASFVYTEQFGLTAVDFGIAFALNGLGFFLANKFSPRLNARFGIPRVVKTAMAAFGILMTSLAISIAVGFANLPAIIAIFFIGYGMLGLAIPSSMARALDNHGHRAGLASSFGGASQFIVSSIILTVFGPVFDGTALPMVSVIAFCGSMSFVVAYFTFARENAEQTA